MFCFIYFFLVRKRFCLFYEFNVYNICLYVSTRSKYQLDFLSLTWLVLSVIFILFLETKKLEKSQTFYFFFFNSQVLKRRHILCFVYYLHLLEMNENKMKIFFFGNALVLTDIQNKDNCSRIYTSGQIVSLRTILMSRYNWWKQDFETKSFFLNFLFFLYFCLLWLGKLLFSSSTVST